MCASRLLAPVAALALALFPASALASAPPTWQAASISAPTGSYGAALDGVACGPAGCLAVGSQTNSSFFQEGYGTASTTGGRSWLPAALPTTGGSFQGLDLAGASCQGSRCVAVGTQRYSSNAILQYQGGSWLPVAAPQPSTFQNGLSGVSCSPAACVAVGSDMSTATYQGVFQVLRSTGGAWSMVAGLPDPGADNLLQGVSCSGSTCVAVGYAAQPTGQTANVVLVSDTAGATWTQESVPQPGVSNNWLSGVSCGSPTSCVAVGYATDPGGINLAEALVTTDGGAHWTAASVPHPGAATNGETLQGVSCVGAQCVAVGQYASQNWTEQNEVLVSTNGGYTWTLQSAPQPAGAYADQMLTAVTCSAAGCVAVGQVSGWSGQQPEVLYGIG